VVAWIPLNLLTFATSGWLSQFRIADLGSGAGAWVLAALACDFSYYWQHRAEHRVRLLWAGHVTHHSSETFNYRIEAWLNTPSPRSARRPATKS